MAATDEALRRLAVAVIEQAWLDFLHLPRGRSEQAKRWFFAAGFVTWAEPLGYDVARWRRKIEEVMPDWERDELKQRARFKRVHRTTRKKR